MLDELRSKYNTNRKPIWAVIGVLVAIFIVIRILNSIARGQLIKEKENANSIKNEQISHAVMSDTKVDEDVQEKTVNLIDKFITYCNNGDITAAYNLLSEKCKEKTYNTQENFEEIFVKGNFETKKEYSFQAWIGDTYKVKIFDDMLATGKSITNNLTTENYMTIVEENGVDKLNIGGYVGTVELEGEEEKDGIKIQVLEKDIFIDYEIYKIKVTNSTEKDIIMDTKEENGTVYITNSSEAMNFAYGNEMTKEDITVDQGTYKTMEIKFANNYKLKRRVESMTFSKIQLDPEDITNTTEMTVEL